MISCADIHDAFDKSGLTYKQLSEKSGVPFGTVCRVMSGHCKEPRQETLQQLQDALEIDSLQESIDTCDKCKVINILERSIAVKNRYIKALTVFTIFENIVLLVSLIALVF